MYSTNSLIAFFLVLGLPLNSSRASQRETVSFTLSSFPMSQRTRYICINTGFSYFHHIVLKLCVAVQYSRSTRGYLVSDLWSSFFLVIPLTLAPFQTSYKVSAWACLVTVDSILLSRRSKFLSLTRYNCIWYISMSLVFTGNSADHIVFHCFFTAIRFRFKKQAVSVFEVGLQRT